MDAKPYILAIIIVAIYAGMYVISKAAFDHGMNSFVFVFYRQAAASVWLLPIALVLGRSTLGLNFSNASVTLTSATVASATSNSTPVITFRLGTALQVTQLYASSIKVYINLSTR
uniref:WAT1-related protein n=1 Tax=Setaria italica TaxID=4555 RepID=K4AGU8_SETIT